MYASIPYIAYCWEGFSDGSYILFYKNKCNENIEAEICETLRLLNKPEAEVFEKNIILCVENYLSAIKVIKTERSRAMMLYFQSKTARKIRIFSPGRKENNNIFKKESVVAISSYSRS